MLSATINEVFMTDLLPLVGVMILSPLLLYLFPLESRLHTLTSWKLINAHRSKPVKDYLYNAKGLLKEGLVIVRLFLLNKYPVPTNCISPIDSTS